MLSSTISAEKHANRQCLLKVAQSIQFLARQAIPLRGNGEDGNSTQLMKLRALDEHSITTYLQHRTDNHVCPQVRSELIMIIDNQILREIALTIQNLKTFSSMADEVTAISNMEQVVICSRHVNESFEPHEDFVGLHTAPLLNQMCLLVFSRLQCYG